MAGLYRPLTPEASIDAAVEAEAKGLTELGVVLRDIADRIAAYNETHPMTIEEVRQALGEDAFWEAFRLTA